MIGQSHDCIFCDLLETTFRNTFRNMHVKTHVLENFLQLLTEYKIIFCWLCRCACLLLAIDNDNGNLSY